MPFAKALNEAASKPKPHKLAVILAGMSKADAKALREALADTGNPSAVIAKALRAEGYVISDSGVAINRWRYLTVTNPDA